MPIKTEPFLDGKFGWNYGENNWNEGVDENILKMSFMINGNIDGVVATLPVSPTNGTAYFLTTDNSLNARVDGAWRKFPTPLGYIARDKVSGARYEFNGSSLVSSLSLADKTKLDGIPTGATVNSTDAQLRDRALHTGSQAISTVTGLQTALNLKADLVSPTFTGIPAAPTALTADDSTKLATTAFVKAQGYMTAAGQMVTSVAGRDGIVVLTKADVGLGSVDNTADTTKPVSTVQQTALNLKANLAGPAFTGTVVLPNTTSIGTVTSTEVSYLLGVSSNIQGQINSLSGSSGAYAPINSPTFTGTVNGITKAMVGLGNVDNTSDASKPVSTLTQTALNLKANIANPAFTGNPTYTSTNTTATYTSTALPVTTMVNYSRFIDNTGSVVGYIGYAQGNGEIEIDNSTRAIRVASPFICNSTLSVTGTVTFTSGVTASTFNGNGASLTSLNASNISSGTLAITRLPYTFTSAATSSTAVLRDGIGDIYVAAVNATTYTGSGTALTALNATNITSGTLNSSRLAFAVSAPSSTNSVVQRDGVGDIYGNNLRASNAIFAGSSLNGTSLNLAQVAPIIVMQDTNSAATGMVSYTSYKDSVGAEVAWFGFGAGNGELGIQNQSRTIRSYSPFACNDVLSVSGFATLGAAASIYNSSAGTVLTLNTGTANGNITCQDAGNIRGYITWSSTGLALQDSAGTSRVTASTSGVLLNGKSEISYTGIASPSYLDAGLLIKSATGNPPALSFYSNGAAGAGLLKFNSSGLFELRGTSGAGGGAQTADLIIESTATLPAATTIGSVTATQLGYIAGVTSSIQTQFSNLNASNLTTGTVAAARLPFTTDVSGNASTVVMRNTDGGVFASGVGGFSSDIITNSRSPIWKATNNATVGLSYFAGTSGDGAANTIGFHFGTATSAGSLFKMREDGRFTAISFLGDGSLISALNATNISSGTLADARLSSNVALVSNSVTKATPSQTFQSIAATGAVSVTAASGMHVLATSTGITTWTFPSPSATEVHALTLELTNGGAFAQTWPTGTRWAGGVAPTLTASGTDVLTFTKAGTANWRGYLSSKDSK